MENERHKSLCMNIYTRKLNLIPRNMYVPSALFWVTATLHFDSFSVCLNLHGWSCRTSWIIACFFNVSTKSFRFSVSLHLQQQQTTKTSMHTKWANWAELLAKTLRHLVARNYYSFYLKPAKHGILLKDLWHGILQIFGGKKKLFGMNLKNMRITNGKVSKTISL